MFSLLQGKGRKSAVVGFGFHADGVSMVVMDTTASGHPRLLESQFESSIGDQAQERAFLNLAPRIKGAVRKAVCVLEPGSYTLLQVESPQVEPEELVSAIRWRVKDLINYHIDDAVIDVYDLPETKRQGTSRMLSVVAARNSLIQRRVDILHQADIPLEAIDITELALRNIAQLSGLEPRAKALVYLAPRFGMIEILRDGKLYLSRQIGINARDLEQETALDMAPQDNLFDSLALEIQRSMDYYESQYAEGGVESVGVIPLSDAATNRFLRIAETSLTIPVERFDFSQYIDGMDRVDSDQWVRWLPTLGGALRVLQ